MATTHDHSALIRNIQLATGVTTVAATGLLAASAHMLFRFAIDTQWKHSIFHQALIAPDREGKMNQGEAKEAEQWFSETKQPVSITSRDGLKLHGWLFDPDCIDRRRIYMPSACMAIPEPLKNKPNGHTAMPAWLHRPRTIPTAQDLSEGRYVGMGWLERNDLLDWIRLIVDSDDQARILLFGGSMGATTVMMTTGTPELPRNVIAAIAESGYTSARMEFIDSARGMFHMPKLLASACVDAAGLICKRRAGYDFTEASCIPSLRHTVIPMLFIHGGKDRMVSPRFLDMNYNACSSIDRERLLVPDADHMESSAVDPKRYWDTVYGFIRRSFKI